MKIVDDKLVNDSGSSLPFRPSPNAGGIIVPQYLIVHFTAGSSAASSIEWFMNPAAKASAHLVIGRDGSIVQLVPFTRCAYHAGISSWQGHSGLNQFSIGIELDNAGKLQRVGTTWQAWFGAIIPDAEVVVAVHKNESERTGWHAYTEAQLAAASAVGALVANHYQLRDVLGHEDIAPGRKVDPGPAFPMASFAARILGRTADETGIFITTTTLNIRSGPGTEFATIPGSPLPPNTRVRILGESGPWRHVDILDTVNSVMDAVGWVHSRFLAEA